MPNRLQHETSPYLLQHAHNPVDWYPWGEEALSKARRENKPIFLSIGYSACHWCHVMERESFEDAATAEILNAHFVSIKVDREERQDVDQLYMSAVQIMTQHGGWPLSVFLTPSLQPFYGGTYFPPEDRHGMPSFKRILAGVANAWKTKKTELESTAQQLVDALVHVNSAPLSTPGDILALELLDNAERYLDSAFDPEHGGFGRAPKFFHSGDLRLLLRQARRTGNSAALQKVVLTLRQIACGGIYDQLGGGFHRYSTDEKWLVPHFEKMLYDNALLAVAFLEAFQATKEPLFGQTASETLDYVLREMTSPQGGFYSTQDADSEGVEGKFFVWSEAEVDALLGPELSAPFKKYFGVTAAGNWEHTNILSQVTSLGELALQLGVEEDVLESTLATAKRKLLAARNDRIAPARDEKILTSWNGLMLEALAMGSQVLAVPHYLEAAEKAADYLLTQMRNTDGKLCHVSKNGFARVDAFLDDYAALALGLVALFEASGNTRWLQEATTLTAEICSAFLDETKAGFYYTAQNTEALITRPRETTDGAIPSASGLALLALVKVGRLTGNAAHLKLAENILYAHRSVLRASPMGSCHMLLAYHLLASKPIDLVFVSSDSAPQETEEALKLKLWESFVPERTLYFWKQSGVSSAPSSPLLEGRTANSRTPTVYVCTNNTCGEPARSAEALGEQLRKL